MRWRSTFLKIYKHVRTKRKARYRIASKNTLKLISKFFEGVKQLPQCLIYPFSRECVVSGRGAVWVEESPANGITLLWLLCLLSHLGLLIKQQLSNVHTPALNTLNTPNVCFNCSHTQSISPIQWGQKASRGPHSAFSFALEITWNIAICVVLM